MRFVTLVKLLLAAAVAFGIAVIAVVKTIDVQQYRLLVTDVLYAATGRSVEIRGDFQLDLSLTPRIVATDVRLANLPNARRPDLLRVARVEAEIGLLALLRREVEVLSLALVEPDLALEIDEAGRPNWLLAPAEMPPAAGTVAAAGSRDRGENLPLTSLRIHRVTIDKGHLVLQDRSAHSVSVLTLNQVSVSAENRATPIAFAAKGQFGALPLDISGTLGSFTELYQQTKPFPVKLQASAGGNHMLLDGSIGTLAFLKDIAFTVALQGNHVAEAARLVGYAVPALGPYRATASITGSLAEPRVDAFDAAIGKKDVLRLTVKGSVAQPLSGRGVLATLVAEADKPAALAELMVMDLPLQAPLKAEATLQDTETGWRLTGLKGMVGATDLAGDLVVDRSGVRPLVTATMASRRMMLEDFGLRPELPLPRAKGEALFRDDALLPLAGLTAVDLDVTWQAEKVTSGDMVLALAPAAATLTLRAGVLRLRPFTAASDGLMSVASFPRETKPRP